MTDRPLYLHLHRHQFLEIVATSGPSRRDYRRCLVCLVAMADHWSCVQLNLPVIARLMANDERVTSAAVAWLLATDWLEPLPEAHLALVHIPHTAKAAFRKALSQGEWHTRDHAPTHTHTHMIAREKVSPSTQSTDTSYPAHVSLGLERLPVENLERQFAYLSFAQQALSPQKLWADTLEEDTDIQQLDYGSPSQHRAKHKRG